MTRSRFGSRSALDGGRVAFRCADCSLVLARLAEYPRCGRCKSTSFRYVLVDARDFDRLPSSMVRARSLDPKCVRVDERGYGHLKEC